MGRPSLGDKAKHSVFSLRVHADELTLWRQLAEKEGLTLTDFVLGPLRKSLKNKGIQNNELNET